MGCGPGSMKVSSSTFPQMHPQYSYEEQHSLPSIRDVVDEKFLPTPSSSMVSYQQPNGEYTASHSVDTRHGYHFALPSNNLQLHLRNPAESCNVPAEQNINLPPLGIAILSQHEPWPAKNIPFCATTQPEIPSSTPHRYSCRQSKVKDEHQEEQSKLQHCDMEKWRRDQIAVYTAATNINMQVLRWPGNMRLTPVSLGPCQVANCAQPEFLNPKYASTYNKRSGIGHAKNTKDGSKRVVLFEDVCWKFSIAVHFQQAKAPIILNNVEEMIDTISGTKEKNLIQAANEKTRRQVLRDITARTAYDLLEYMLKQCRDHAVQLDEGIAARQKARRIRLGIETAEKEKDCWGERKGTPGSSRTFSEYEGDNEEERGGKRHCSEDAHSSSEDQ